MAFLSFTIFLSRFHLIMFEFVCVCGQPVLINQIHIHALTAIKQLRAHIQTHTHISHKYDMFLVPPLQFMDSLGNNAAKAKYEQIVPAFYYQPTYKDCT